MTELRRKMLEDMQLHGYAERTRESYADAVGRLAKHYNRPPDQLTEDDIRNFFLHLINERKSARSTLVIYLSGIKFFFEKTLGRKWKVFDLLLPPKSKKLPVVLSKREVEAIISKVRNATIKMVLTLIYVCGLRLHEAVASVRVLAFSLRASPRLGHQPCGGSKGIPVRPQGERRSQESLGPYPASLVCHPSPGRRGELAFHPDVARPSKPDHHRHLHAPHQAGRTAGEKGHQQAHGGPGLIGRHA
jgi:hypothetical protein